jgi:tetratricopeptide (TPR) repeat protein
VAWALVDRMLAGRLLSLSAGSRTLVWAHRMLRESAEQRAIAGGRAARWHRLCAEALAEKPLETVAERLGRHRLRAGDVEGALRPLLLAARRRDLHGDPAGALAVLNERATAMESARIPAAHAAWPEGQLLEAELHRYTGVLVDAARIAGRAWEAARLYGHFHLIGDLLVVKAEIARSEGRTAEAAALLRRAFPHVEAAGDHARLASLLHSIVRVELDLGNADDAARAAAEALEASERAGDTGLVGWSHEKLGKVHEWHGRIEEAQRCFERAAALAAEHALPRLETTALLGLATVLRERGLLDQAEGLLRRAAAIDRRSGDASAVFTELNIATVLLESSKFGEARALLDRCADHPLAGRSPFLVAAISLSRAAAAAGEGDFEQYDRDIATVERALSGSAIIDIDFARVSCLAGDHAAEAGVVARASRAWDMARAHYLALGRSREAESLPRPRS